METERREEAWGGQRGEVRKQETEAKIILFSPIEDTRLSPGNRGFILFLTEMGLMGGRGQFQGQIGIL